MTGCPCSNGVYPKGGVDMKSDLMNGGSRRDLEGTSPLRTISSLRAKLLEKVRGVEGHE